MKRLALAFVTMLAACGSLPRDPAGTSERVAREHQFSVGFADSGAHAAPAARALIREIERQSGARPVLLAETGEALTSRLTKGEVDLVVGQFSSDSPWKGVATFAPPLAVSREGDGQVELKAAMRNGENRWIMAVERASRASSGEARR